MAATASESFQNRLKRWWRSVTAALRKARDITPQLVVCGGAALGFYLSWGFGSWLVTLVCTVLGYALGVAVLVLSLNFLDGLKSIMIRTAIFLGGTIVVATLLMALAG